MPKRHLHRAAHFIDRSLDRRARTRSGKIVVSPYRGFGRANEMLLRGRVLLEKSVTRAREAESVWRNLVNTYHRFASDEVAGAKVRGSYRDAVVETVSDDEGHFQIRLQPAEMAQHTLWHQVAVELPEHGASAVTEVMIPSEAATFGVISDIDDTIVQTNATSLLRMVRSIVNNAAARLPFEGVTELYKALHVERNPIFYVSSSPWNLYELLHDYMDLNGIPHGPMLLQDWGIDDKTLILADHSTHKLAQIQTLLDYYPWLRWVLIGDSGQHDPEIYLEVVRSHKERVKAVMIRDVTGDVRDVAVAKIANEAASHGVEFVYMKDSKEALAHAQRLGLTS